jgi:predicted neuraminidase
MFTRSSWSALVISTYLVLFQPSLGATPSGQNDPQMVVESRSVVFNIPQTDPYDPSNHYGFNHAPSVVRMPDGRLFCAWFSAPYEASVHQVILAADSDDGGRTWHKAYVLQDEPRKSDFDPAFVVDGNRVWFFYIYGRWNRYPSVLGAEGTEKSCVGTESYHLFGRYSDDSGKAWSEEKKLHEKACCRSNGIKLVSGELLLGVNDITNMSQTGVMKSTDGGKSWQLVGKVTNPTGVGEPTIAQLKNGDILMALRTNDGNLWTALSKDKGENWQKPVKHDMLATSSSHNLFRISDGRVLLTHNPCKPSRVRSPLTIRLTEDGMTWSDPLVLATSLTPGMGNDYWACEVCYPSVCQLEDKTVVVVYAEINVSNLSQYGDIHCVRVKVRD